MEADQEQQQTGAPKKDWAADGFAVLSTISKFDAGYPGGSIVGFAPEPVTGRPLFSLLHIANDSLWSSIDASICRPMESFTEGHNC